MAIFKFKQFHVDDRQCGMPVSTDGILLGAWAPLPINGHIIDIGTGSGLLALIAAQRSPNAFITALEIEQNAVDAASDNFQSSPYSHQLQLVHADAAKWAYDQPAQSMDSVICNPPYFTSGQSAKSATRAQARHADEFTHQDLVAVIAHLLTSDGGASLILPKLEGDAFIALAAQHALYCSHYCEVQPTVKKPASRVLFRLQKSQCQTITSHLLIHRTDGQYSDAFTRLTWPYYLKMQNPDAEDNLDR